MLSQSPSNSNSSTVSWAPQPGPQHAALHCPYREIFFGGSRGGGKTDLLIGRFGYRAGLYGKDYNGVIFRAEMPQSDDLIERAKEVYAGVADYAERQTRFVFHNGARIRFRPLQTIQDAMKYQGQNLQDAGIEEIGNYPDPAPILRLFAVLRSAKGHPTSLFATGNPGGPGQQWVKKRYIDPAPNGMTPIEHRFTHHGNTYTHRSIFIPSSIEQNRILLHNDPQYIANLHLVGSAELVRAWLSGDWDAVEGAYFDVWDRSRHVVRPFEIPEHWLRFRSMDWGSARPFSVGWWAIVSDDHRTEEGLTLPRGCMVRYREWYGAKSPNEGLKLTAEAVAQGIKERTPEGETIGYTVADPAIWSEDGGPSIAERLGNAGVICQRADNRRTGREGAMGGWDTMRQRLVGESPGRPMAVCFTTCEASIRTIPALQHDQHKPEDLDTASEDHAADEWRYACMSRPWVKARAVDVDPVAEMQKPLTFDQQLQIAEAGKAQGRI